MHITHIHTHHFSHIHLERRYALFRSLFSFVIPLRHTHTLTWSALQKCIPHLMEITFHSLFYCTSAHACVSCQFLSFSVCTIYQINRIADIFKMLPIAMHLSIVFFPSSSFHFTKSYRQSPNQVSSVLNGIFHKVSYLWVYHSKRT